MFEIEKLRFWSPVNLEKGLSYELIEMDLDTWNIEYNCGRRPPWQ